MFYIHKSHCQTFCVCFSRVGSVISKRTCWATWRSLANHGNAGRFGITNSKKYWNKNYVVLRSVELRVLSILNLTLSGTWWELSSTQSPTLCCEPQVYKYSNIMLKISVTYIRQNPCWKVPRGRLEWGCSTVARRHDLRLIIQGTPSLAVKQESKRKINDCLFIQKKWLP